MNQASGHGDATRRRDEAVRNKNMAALENKIAVATGHTDAATPKNKDIVAIREEEEDILDLRSWSGKRVIIHMIDDSRVSGLLRYVTSDRVVILTEAINVDIDGTSIVLGKSEVTEKLIFTVCLKSMCQCTLPPYRNFPKLSGRKQ